MTLGSRGARSLVIALAALLPFIHTLRFGFVYDDVPIIVERTELHAPGGLVDAWRIPYWPASAQEGAGLYRPVAQMAYAALWSSGGGSPLPFHLYVVLLHALAALLVLALLSRLLPDAAAFAGALIFAVHPVHVEAVANIVGSAEVLVAICALGYALVLLRASGRAGESSISWRSAAPLALIYAVALGSKESGVTVPVVGALVLAGLGHRDPIRRAWRVWALSGLALIVMTVARHAVLGTLSVDPEAVAIGIKGVTASERVWTMLAAMPLVGELLLWPSRLMMHYGHSTIVPQDGPSMTAVVSVALIAVLGAAAAVRARSGDWRPLVALGWMAITFLPASNLLVPTGQLLAERTLYLPSVGVALLAGWMLARLAERVPARTPARALALPVLVLASLGAARAATAASRWRDNFTLFNSGIAADPLAYRPHLSLASWHLQQGHRGEAMALYEHAYSLYARDPKLALNYGRELMADGETERALGVLRQGLADAPRSTLLRVQYLSALLAARGPDSLLRDVRSHPQPDPARASLPLFVARAFEVKGERDSVARVMGEAAAVAPRDGSLAFLYAAALHRARRPADAARQLDAADRLGDAPLIARSFLRAQIALALGDTTLARSALATAKLASPGDTAVLRLEADLRSRGS
jgi:Tfp pilus assembly protein PilF